MKLNKNLFAIGIAIVTTMMVVFACSPIPEKVDGDGNDGEPTYSTTAIYVSTSGNDANDGLSPANAVLTIQDAILLATNAGYNDVYVEAGVYIQGAGLSNNVAGNNYAGINIVVINNINLVGGWSSDFSSQSGYSILDGENSLCHIIWADELTNLTINGFVVCNGNANGISPHSRAGGIYFKTANYSVVTNCIISNNTASENGGGLYLMYADNNIIRASVNNNIVSYNGGGLFLNNADNNTISGSIYNNTASWFGGGLFLFNVTNNIISVSVYNNTASRDGGGLFLDNADTNTFSGHITNNTAGTGYLGGGVWIDSTAVGNIFTATSVVRWNTVTGGSIGDGGGVYNEAGAGTQTTNTGFVCSNNSPDDWADKP